MCRSYAIEGFVTDLGSPPDEEEAGGLFPKKRDVLKASSAKDALPALHRQDLATKGIEQEMQTVGDVFAHGSSF